MGDGVSCRSRDNGSSSFSFFAQDCDIPLRDDAPASGVRCTDVEDCDSWTPELHDEIAAMFGALVVLDLWSGTPAFRCMHTASPKDAGIRVRRIGRDEEARADWRRSYLQRPDVREREHRREQSTLRREKQNEARRIRRQRAREIAATREAA